MADDAPDDAELSPAHPALVRQLVLDILPDERAIETWAAVHESLRGPKGTVDNRRLSAPLRLTLRADSANLGDAGAIGLKLSPELVRWLDSPLPLGHRLMSRLQAHDDVLARRYVAYLRALRRESTTARRLPPGAVARLAVQWACTPRTVQRIVREAETFLVEAVHVLHLQQIERMQARLAEGVAQLETRSAEEIWPEA